MEDSTLPLVQQLALYQQHQLQQSLLAVQQLEQERLTPRQQALAEAALEAHLSQPQR